MVRESQAGKEGGAWHVCREPCAGKRLIEVETAWKVLRSDWISIGGEGKVNEG